MTKISADYDKLSKDDPVKQLEAYRKELTEIEKQRKELSSSTAVDKNNELIDTSEALEQLDYIEKKIREKIQSLQNDGKKSWR